MAKYNNKKAPAKYQGFSKYQCNHSKNRPKGSYGVKS